MHKLALIATAILLVGVAQPAAAVPIACTTMTTLDEYITQSGAGGCFVEDKLFTEFSYVGGGAVGADDVGVTTVFNIVGPTDIQGFVFAPVSGAWTTDFTLGYSIAVDPPNPDVNIIGAKLQINTGIPNTDTTATSTKSNGVIQVATGIPANETQIDLFPGVQSLISSTVVTFNAPGALLVSLEEDYVQLVEARVPEPGTLLLLGSALVGLGGLSLARTRSRRK